MRLASNRKLTRKTKTNWLARDQESVKSVRSVQKQSAMERNK